MVWENIISAGASLLGGLMGKDSDDDNRAAAAKQAARELAFSREQFDWQKKLSTEGIRMRVADAEAAGIHKNIAAGVQPSSFSPVSIGSQPYMSGNPMGEALSAAGENIGRAISASSTPMERLQEKLLSAQIDGQEIDNAKKRADLALNSQVGPAFPAPGSTSADGSINVDQLPALQGYGGAAPLFKMAYLRDGSAIRVYNDASGDNEFLMAATLPVSAMDWAANRGRYLHRRYMDAGHRFIGGVRKFFSR